MTELDSTPSYLL